MIENISLMIIFIGLSISVFKKRADSNKFHLDYFLYHMVVLFLLPIIYLFLIFSDSILNRYYYAIGGAIHILSFIFMILHVESSVKGYKAKIKVHHILPFVIYVFLSTLDFFNIYLFEHATIQSKFYNIELSNKISFNNILLIKQTTSIYLYVYLFYTYTKSIKNSSTVKKKKVYTRWVYSYIAMFLFSILSTSFLFYGFFNSSYDVILQNINKVVAVMNVFYFIATPAVLYYLPLIKLENVLHIENRYLNFDRLKLLFESEKIFLNDRLCLRSVSLMSGLNEITIRTLIKKGTGLNFNDFVNRYRVEYAIEIMKSGFLENHLITALGEKSGFKSNITFYRAFKKQKNQTPSYYYKKEFKS